MAAAMALDVSVEAMGWVVLLAVSTEVSIVESAAIAAARNEDVATKVAAMVPRPQEVSWSPMRNQL